MKKICIALDYNPTAEKIAETGYAYAKALGAEIALVHVISDVAYYARDYEPFMGYESSFNPASVKVAAELVRVADNFLITIAEHLGGSDIRTEVLEGGTANTILDYCNENDVDLLVMGTHSHSVLENILMGSTAVKVVRHAKIPLLVVPTKK